MQCTLAIEWDNLRLAELSRAQAMAAVLRDELATFEAEGGQVQALVLYDPGVVDRGQPCAVFEQAGFDPAWVDAALVGVPGAGYYDLKNHAATLALAPVLIFLDSDVVPEPGWLAAMLKPFADSGTHVVTGTSYIQPRCWYTRSMAALWLFPPRSGDDETPGPATRFTANGVAFRTEVFLAHRFPTERRFRGQCGSLTRTLLDQGYRLLRQPQARVDHPPPHGLRNFWNRAVSAGSDARQRRGPWRRLRKRIRTRRHALDLTPSQLLVAHAVAAVYALGMWVGMRLQRRVVERYFHI